MGLLQFFLLILGMYYTGEHKQVSRSIRLPHAFPVKAVALQSWHDSSHCWHILSRPYISLKHTEGR